jgi:hypothetical protein
MTPALLQSIVEDTDDMAFTDDDHQRLATRITRVEDALQSVVVSNGRINATLEGAVQERRDTAQQVRDIAASLNQHIGEHRSNGATQSKDHTPNDQGMVRIGLAIIDLFKAQPIITVGVLIVIMTLGGTGVVELIERLAKLAH